MSLIKIIQTEDGSHTLFSEQYKAHYHSLKGALQESLHIFIENGYKHSSKNEVNVLEVGFGTGLNAALTASQAVLLKRTTYYTGIELYPPTQQILSGLNYDSILPTDSSINWKKINSLEWNAKCRVNDFFTIEKIQDDFINIELNQFYDIIYFDAFAPDDQPEMWSESIFYNLFKHTNPEGFLVTYCAKGIVKQALKSVGFKVARLAGPIGKRHILRATHL